MYQVIFHLLLLASVNGVCEDNWLSIDLYCYYISEVAMSFDNSYEHCRRSDSNLVTILDRVENEYLHFHAMNMAYDSYWIGLKKVTSSIWRWNETGTVGNFLNWDIGEPDGQGRCSRLTPYNKGRWRDFSCDEELRFICKKYADCGRPPFMAHSTTAVTHGSNLMPNQTIYPEGSVATYTCNEGFEYLDGSMSKTSGCSVGGIWYPPLSTNDVCEPKLCKTPPSYQNVLQNGTNEFYDFGTVISYDCRPGFWFSQYELNVTKYLYCGDDKKWHGENITSCSEVYCVRPVTNNAVANTSLNAEGTVASYACLKGYKYYEDNSTFKVFRCGESGWVPPPKQCKIKKCPFYNVTHATPSTWSTDYDTLVIWQCNPGRRYTDTSTRKTMYCQENEQWNKLVTDNCERKKCLGEPANHTETRSHNWNSSLVYKYSDEITYTCIEGWYFQDKEQSNTREARCDENGEWSPKVIGECVGDPIVVKTVHYHEPKEKKGGEVYVSIGLIAMGLVVGLVVILDLSTIGLHFAIMKANILNRPISEEMRNKARRHKARVRRRINGKTVITTDKPKQKLHKQNTKKVLMIPEDKAFLFPKPEDEKVILMDEEEADKELQKILERSKTDLQARELAVSSRLSAAPVYHSPIIGSRLSVAHKDIPTSRTSLNIVDTSTVPQVDAMKHGGEEIGPKTNNSEEIEKAESPCSKSPVSSGRNTVSVNHGAVGIAEV